MKQTVIIHIVTTLELGGAQKVCLSLFDGLLKDPQYKAYLIAGNDGILHNDIHNNPHVFIIPSIKWRISLRNIPDDIRSFFSLITIFRKIKRQHSTLIIHTHTAKAGILGRWAAFFVGIKYRIHTIHGHAFLQRKNLSAYIITFIFEWITSFITTHFICVSYADLRIGKQSFPFFAHKSSIIRAAIDETRFHPASLIDRTPPLNTFVIGTVACFKPVKNVIDLLKAFEYVHGTIAHARLEIIGDGEQRVHIENWIAEHQLSKSITLHGWQKDVIPFMQQWHVFSLTSLHEGLPCALIEARALGLPTFCYNAGGIGEIINDGVDGKLFTIGNWQSLAQELILFGNKKLTLSSPARKLPQEFTVAHMVHAHKKIYRELKRRKL